MPENTRLQIQDLNKYILDIEFNTWYLQDDSYLTVNVLKLNDRTRKVTFSANSLGDNCIILAKLYYIKKIPIFTS